MFGWLKTWRERRALRKLIRTMAVTLRQRYGPEKFYTPGQVLKTCDVLRLDDEAKANSVAMYVRPELADGILSKLNKSVGARELRKYLIARCFDSFSDGSGATSSGERATTMFSWMLRPTEVSALATASATGAMATAADPAAWIQAAGAVTTKIQHRETFPRSQVALGNALVREASLHPSLNYDVRR